MRRAVQSKFTVRPFCGPLAHIQCSRAHCGCPRAYFWWPRSACRATRSACRTARSACQAAPSASRTSWSWLAVFSSRCSCALLSFDCSPPKISTCCGNSIRKMISASRRFLFIFYVSSHVKRPLFQCRLWPGYFLKLWLVASGLLSLCPRFNLRIWLPAWSYSERQAVIF